MYRIAFVFHEQCDIGANELTNLLDAMGERTFHIVEEDHWFHNRYESDVYWRHDPENHVLVASIENGAAVRTCGSLVEWMLRNASRYLADVERDLRGLSLF
jgi:hypothetical protein